MVSGFATASGKTIGLPSKESIESSKKMLYSCSQLVGIRKKLFTPAEHVGLSQEKTPSTNKRQPRHLEKEEERRETRELAIPINVGCSSSSLSSENEHELKEVRKIYLAFRLSCKNTEFFILQFSCRKPSLINLLIVQHHFSTPQQ
jgi:hypothetical protein